LFPHWSKIRSNDRAARFGILCKSLGISGITLHSYRYAWAERAKVAGYPERFAQEALGHKSAAVHRAYAKKARVELPPLEDYAESSRECSPPSDTALLRPIKNRPDFSKKSGRLNILAASAVDFFCLKKEES
jgi:hypothetical protein